MSMSDQANHESEREKLKTLRVEYKACKRELDSAEKLPMAIVTAVIVAAGIFFTALGYMDKESGKAIVAAIAFLATAFVGSRVILFAEDKLEVARNDGWLVQRELAKYEAQGIGLFRDPTKLKKRMKNTRIAVMFAALMWVFFFWKFCGLFNFLLQI